jgi:hypothetical protein
MKTKRDIGNELENLVVSYLLPIDKKARRTKASGGSTEIGDVMSQYFFTECKKWDKENVIIDQKIWQHLLNQLPINSDKTPILVQSSNNRKIFVSLEIKDFFSLLYKLNELGGL